MSGQTSLWHLFSHCSWSAVRQSCFTLWGIGDVYIDWDLADSLTAASKGCVVYTQQAILSLMRTKQCFNSNGIALGHYFHFKVCGRLKSFEYFIVSQSKSITMSWCTIDLREFAQGSWGTAFYRNIYAHLYTLIYITVNSWKVSCGVYY
jgi:hypothetical protein